MKIILDEAPGTTYPAVVRSVGEAPKQFGNVFNPTVVSSADDDFDFLNEMAFNPEDAEDFSEVTDTGVDDVEEKKADDEEGEEDEFGFGDDEEFEDEDKPGRGDDY
jgi:hypothetical protein